jgi:diadenosine tetraphosphate (Ap4A) HIT family hydrolase
MKMYTLWENHLFTIGTPENPHQPYSEGLHVIVAPKLLVKNAWEDVELGEATFKIATQTCRVIEDLKLAPWQNIQANGNWGLLPGREPHFHVHIYGRNKTASWGKPIILPEARGTYSNEPMPLEDRDKLTTRFNEVLDKQ